jgi:Domain of Unknown Function (DUF1206)
MVTGSARRKVRTAGNSGRKAANSGVMAGLARAGFVARGIMYVLIGWIALQIAFGHSGQQADRSGALRLVAKTPFGSVTLWVLVIGFIGMALWRLSEAIWGAAGPDGHKASARLGSLARAVLYSVIAYGVLKFALGLGAPPSSDKQSQDLTATAMSHPGGKVVVAIVGVVLIAIGVSMVYKAWKKKFLRELRLGSASPAARRAVRWIGEIGGIARGTVFTTAGIFLVVAAATAQPGEAKGIDSSLRVLASTPLGPWLLALVAAGLIVFGVYSFCEARWRNV